MPKLAKELKGVYYDIELAKKITESGKYNIQKMVTLLEKYEVIQHKLKKINYRKHIIETLWH